MSGPGWEIRDLISERLKDLQGVKKMGRKLT